MNKQCHRLVFNRARGALMAVQECASSVGAGGASGERVRVSAGSLFNEAASDTAALIASDGATQVQVSGAQLSNRGGTISGQTGVAVAAASALLDDTNGVLVSGVVWLTTQSVTLADGSTADVLVPQVYLRHAQDGDVAPGGGLMAGKTLLVSTPGDVANSAALRGDAVTLLGQNVSNTGSGSAIATQDLDASATNDLQDLSGGLRSVEGSLILHAGRDLIVKSATTSTSLNTSTAGGTTSSERTSIERIATLQAGQDILLSAGRNVLVAGADLQAGGNVQAIAAGRVTLDPVITGYRLNITGTGTPTMQAPTMTGWRTAPLTSHLNLAADTVQGTQVQAGGNLILRAGVPQAADAPNPALTTQSTTEPGIVSLAGATLHAGQHIDLSGQSVEISTARQGASVDNQAAQRRSVDHGTSIEEQLSASELTAGDQIIVIANGDAASGQGNITITGSHLRSGLNVDAAAAASAAAAAAAAGVPDSEAHGLLYLQATGDVTVQSAQTKTSTTQEGQTRRNGPFSSSASNHQSASSNTRASASTLSGTSLLVTAGRDITVAGSDLVADNDVLVKAGRHLTLTTSEQSTSSDSYAKETKGGFIAQNAGVTLGDQYQDQTQTSRTTQQRGSTVGSLGGNVVLQAGDTYTQTGSQTLALGHDPATSPGSVLIEGAKVLIDTAYDTAQATDEQHVRQSGLTVAFTAGALSALQTAKALADAAEETDDSRMQALAMGGAGLATANAFRQAEAARQARQAAGGDYTARDVASALGGVGISISVGASRNDSRSTQSSTTAMGSFAAAEGDVTIRATGRGQDSTITITGSDVQSTHGTTLLKADGDSGATATAISSGAGSAAGGSVAGALTGANADFNNRQLHPEEKQKLIELQRGRSQADQQRLADAACYRVQCAEQMSDDNPLKANALASQQRGAGYLSEQQELASTGLFRYSTVDVFNDRAGRVGDWSLQQLASAGRGAVNLGQAVVAEMRRQQGSGNSPLGPDDLNRPGGDDGMPPTAGAVVTPPVVLCSPMGCVVAPPVVVGGAATAGNGPGTAILNSGNGENSTDTPVAKDQQASQATSGPSKDPSPCVAGEACFVAGTPVWTLEGLRPIETLHTGTLVLTRHEHSFDPGVRRITATKATSEQAIHELVLQSEAGIKERLHVTSEHPFWVTNKQGGAGWLRAADLDHRAHLTNARGELVRVLARQVLEDLQTVYSIQVEESHTYYVGEFGVWVHNARCCDVVSSTPAAPTQASGHLNKGKIGNGALDWDTPAELASDIRDIAVNGDITGRKTEDLVSKVLASDPDITVLSGTKYAGNNGLDHVVQFRDPNTGIVKTLIIDSKQLSRSGTSRLDPQAAGSALQLSDNSIEVIVDRLGRGSEAARAVEVARDSNTLIKAIAFIDKAAGKLRLLAVTP